MCTAWATDSPGPVGACWLGMSGMLASALLSSIDGRLLYRVVGQFPLRQQRLVGAVRDQGVQRRHAPPAAVPFPLPARAMPGEMGGEMASPTGRIGVGLEVHDVGQRLIALGGRIDPSLP